MAEADKSNSTRRRFGVLLRSTPDSAHNLQPTWLAIAETVIATALYIWIAVESETAKYLAAAVVLAPLALFRTRQSMAAGIQWMQRYVNWAFFGGEGRWVRALVVGTTFMPLVGFSIRVVTTLWSTLKHPIEALVSVPDNWFRQALCTDFFHPPEGVPGESIVKQPSPFIVAVQSLRDTLKSPTSFFKVALLATLPTVVLLYLPSVIYRITFKATALVYAPLIWVVQTTLRLPLPTAERLDRIKSGQLEKARRWWSSFALSLLVVKIGILVGWIAPSYIEARLPSPQVIDIFVVPSHLPVWQVVIGINCVLTFFLLWISDAALPRLKRKVWKERPVEGTVAALSFIRGILSLYTVTVGFLIAWQEVWPMAVH